VSRKLNNNWDIVEGRARAYFYVNNFLSYIESNNVIIQNKRYMKRPDWCRTKIGYVCC